MFKVNLKSIVFLYFYIYNYMHTDSGPSLV